MYVSCQVQLKYLRMERLTKVNYLFVILFCNVKCISEDVATNLLELLFVYCSCCIVSCTVDYCSD